jgi:hypothetical protein
MVLIRKIKYGSLIPAYDLLMNQSSDLEMTFSFNFILQCAAMTNQHRRSHALPNGDRNVLQPTGKVGTKMSTCAHNRLNAFVVQDVHIPWLDICRTAYTDARDEETLVK